MRAAVERDVEACRIRDAAPAKARGGINHRNLQPRRGKPPSSRYTGRAGPNDNRIDEGAGLPSGKDSPWLRNRGTARDGRRGGQK